MFLLYGVPLGLAAGLLLGGRLGRLAEVRIRWGWLFYAAVAVQLVAFPSGLFPWSVGEQTATVLWLGSYGLVLAAAARNAALPGAAIAAAGTLSNLVAVLANGGDMPMTDAARAAAAVEVVHNNSSSVADPSLPWLVDRFAAPTWLPGANVFSVGDVLIIAGTALLVAWGMGARLRMPSRQPAVGR